MGKRGVHEGRRVECIRSAEKRGRRWGWRVGVEGTAVKELMILGVREKVTDYMNGKV